MEYSVVGFPRLGEHRELKFAVEKYFGSQIDEAELKRIVDEQRALQWQMQKTAGARYIPSNDYSLYDGMLDTSFMLNAVPDRYEKLGLSDTDTYFAMGRGYQGPKGDVKAFTMKKWFNTNYHYMVPELDDDMQIRLRSDAFLDGYRQAKSLGIETKPVVIGPYTFLKLARTAGTKKKDEFVDAVAAAYKDILKAAAKEGVEWIQIDEPSLVMDMTEDDKKLLKRLYEDILSEKGDVRVLLQTYFGDVRDCYKDLCELAFDGIGLDFVEGKKSFALVSENGFPKDKILFAGLVNGKNIWRASFEKILDQLGTLKKSADDIVLSTSCSLLHVPYTVANEPSLPKEVKDRFAFACEKLDEMRTICELAETPEYKDTEAYRDNLALFAKSALRTNEDVQKRVSELTDSDFSREMPRKERQAMQRDLLGLPDLPTTTIGSFPQTKEVKQNRARFRRGEISEEEYKENAKKAIADCIRLQEEIGLDVLVHGEFERNDMVEFFGENLNGYVFTDNAWVQSYGTRGLKPPIVFGDIQRDKPITAEYIAYANSLTDKDVKGMLTGPVTILNWSFPREDISTQEMMYQIALAIREEVEDLEKAGVRIIQIDEAALREKLPLRKDDWHTDYLDFAIPAFRICHAKTKPETQIHTHMCYSEFEDIIPEIDAMDADVITFEASRSKLSILDSLKENNFETEVGPGVYDIHSPRVPSVDEIVSALRTMLEKIPAQNLWVNPDCGLKTRGEEETVASLKNLVEAAKKVREELE